MKHWPMFRSAATCCNIPYARWQSDGVELASDAPSVDCPGCAVGLRYDAIINDHMEHFARCCALLGIYGYEARKSSAAACDAIEAAVEALVKGGKA